jgi:hypothetical protein
MKARIIPWRDNYDAERAAFWAELQKPPKIRRKPTGQFWAGACLLTLCAVVSYLFWSRI